MQNYYICIILLSSQIQVYLAQYTTKKDWIYNYNALPCTCPESCCLTGSVDVQDDPIMQDNFVLLNGKTVGGGCDQTKLEIKNVVCIIDSMKYLSTAIRCPKQHWNWNVRKDNITGSIYWKDNEGCQGIWNTRSHNNLTETFQSGLILTMSSTFLMIIFLF